MASAEYTYSPWTWSPDQQKYYCAAYNAAGEIVEFHWQGGYRQVVQQTRAAHQPETSVNDITESLGRTNLSSPNESSRTPRTVSQQPQHPSSSVYQYSATTATSSSQPLQRTSSASSHSYYATTAATTYHQQQQHATSSQYPSSSPPANYVATSSPSHVSYTPTSYFDQRRTTSQSPYASPNQYYTSTQSSSSRPQQPTPSVQSPPDPLPVVIQQTVGGDKKTRHIKTDEDGVNYEKLHPSFKRVSAKDHDRFFIRGRVFKMLWTEPAGMVNPGVTRGSTHYSLVRFNEGAWSEIRRFVVIQNKGSFSQCIPIQSYRGQGAAKPGLVVADHAVIYTGFPGAQPPSTFKGEEAIVKQALRVHPKQGESLNDASRINFGKPYAVEHNVKLSEIGIVAEDHLHLLVTYFMEAMGLN